MSGPVSGDLLHVDYDVINASISTLAPVLTDLQGSVQNWNNALGNLSIAGQFASTFFSVLTDNAVAQRNQNAINYVQMLMDNLNSISDTTNVADGNGASQFSALQGMIA